jgi:uncharacterized membrane protein
VPQEFTPTALRSTHAKISATIDHGKTRHAITIGKPVIEVYEFWRKFENLPKFMKDVRKVSTVSPTRSHWEIELQSGRDVVWDADITAEVPGQMISWQSVEGSEIETSGTVCFEKADGGRGTVVSLSMNYEIPGGKLAEWITFFGGEDPDTLVLTNLKRLKGLLETGEIATTEGQSSGRENAQTLHH